MTGPSGRWLVRLVVLAALVWVAVAALPGGPADLGRFDGVASTPGASASGTPPAPTTAPATASGASPWGRELLVVTVRNRAAPDRDVSGAVAEALEYWNGNPGFADYPASFVLRADAERPDVVVWYNDTIDCPDHADAIGCAPLLEADRVVDPPVAVQIRHAPDDNRRQVRNTAIHELGHVLGLDHCEEPHWVMASACGEPIPDAPDATERASAWRDGTVTVHVGLSNVSADERAETREQVDHALAYLQADPGDEIPADVTIVEVDDRFDADVTVTFLAGPGCPDGSVVCYAHHGRDYDRDGRMEYYTRGEVSVVPDTDVAARGWYVGRALAHEVAPGYVPSVFEDASYRERRSRWWETGRSG